MNSFTNKFEEKRKKDLEKLKFGVVIFVIFIIPRVCKIESLSNSIYLILSRKNKKFAYF